MLPILHSLDELPSLGEYVDNTECLTTLKSKSKILFFPITVYDKDINWKYSLVIYGNLIGGTPAVVILTDVILPFYVKWSKRAKVTALLKAKNWRCTSKLVCMKYLDKDSESEAYMEITTSSLVIRILAIKLLTNERFEVFENDTSKLHRNAMAHYKIEPSAWLEVDKYKIILDHTNVYKRYHKGIVLVTQVTDVCNYKGPIRPILKKSYRKLAWDIETKTYGKIGDPVYYRVDPKVYEEYDVIKQISMCFRWSSAEDMIHILLTVEDQDPSDKYYVILCTDQFDMIKKFFLLFDRYRPNIDMGFNTMGFDWRMIYHRFLFMSKADQTLILNKLKFCDEDDKNRRYQDFGWKDNVEIKLGGSNKIIGTTFHFTDCVHYDLLPALLQDFEYMSGEKANIRGLNAFLEDNNLDAKKDMPYERMFAIFDTGDKEQLKIVGDYCMHDSSILHKLEEKRSMIMTLFEFGNITYTFPKDGIYYANGLKITNSVRSECKDKGHLMQSGKYQLTDSKYGALVLVTNAGFFGYNSYDMDTYSEALQTELKATRNGDFERESLKRTSEYIETIQDPGLKEELYNLLKEKPPRDIDYVWKADRGLIPDDYASLYPNTMIEFNLSPDTVVHSRAEYESFSPEKQTEYRKMVFFDNKERWIRQHGGDESKMGILPSIQKRVYDMRVDIKTKQIPALYKSITDNNKEEVMFNIAVLNSKQMAQKIFINSVYGLLNDKTNRYFYSPYLSQGVCNGGRFALICAKIISEHYGFVVYYGDTDSVYLCPPNEYYEELDAEYENRSIDIYEYKKKMVEIDLKVKYIITDKINNHIHNAMNHKFLTVNPEEILSNQLMITKKFYSALKHGKEYNDDYIRIVIKEMLTDYVLLKDLVKEHILQKGMATKRRDKSPFQQEIMRRLLVALSDPAVNKSLLELCLDIVLGLDSMEYDKDLFKMYGTYRSAKSNQKNNMFVRNMYTQYNITISDLQKFPYYITSRPEYEITMSGKRDDSIGNKMVYASVVEEQNIKLDYTYYANSVINMLSSILAVHYHFKGDKDAAAEFMTTEYNKKVGVVDRRSQTQFNKKLFKKLNNTDIDKVSYKFDELVVGSDNKIKNIVDNICSEISNEISDDDVVSINEYGKVEIKDTMKKMEFIALIDKSNNFYKSLIQTKLGYSDKKYRDLLMIIKRSINYGVAEYRDILKLISENLDNAHEEVKNYDRYIFETISTIRNSSSYQDLDYTKLLENIKDDSYETPASILEFDNLISRLKVTIRSIVIMSYTLIHFKN